MLCGVSFASMASHRYVDTKKVSTSISSMFDSSLLGIKTCWMSMVPRGSGYCSDMIIVWDDDVPGDFEAAWNAGIDYMLDDIGNG